MSFDDLVPEALADKRDITWSQRWTQRIELEKRIFSNTDIHAGLREAPVFARDTLFHCRWVGPLYAVGTAVTRTSENDAVYEAIAKDSTARQLSTFSSDFKLRISEAGTVAKAEELLVAIGKIVQSFEEDKDKDASAEAKLLKALCEARLVSLREDEAAVLKAHETVDDANATDEDGPVVVDEEDDPKPTGSDGSGVDVFQRLFDYYAAEHEAKADAVKKEIKTEEAPAPAPAVETIPTFVEFDPTGLSSEALQARLEKMPRPVHVVSTLTLPVDEKTKAFPFEAITDPLTAPPAHTVFAHQLDHKGRGPFEQITDKTMTGTLWTCSMNATAQGTSKWRPLKKTRIQIPCCFAGNGQELLVVDHDKAIILRMPKGTATEEVYTLRVDTTQRTQFKISHCDLTKDYVCIGGFRPGETRPVVLVYSRRKPLCTAFQTSIPVTSAILSRHHAGHLLLGMKDGTLLRVAIPSVASRRSRPTFSLYNPVVDKPDAVAIKRLRKARGAFKLDETPTTEQDCVIHMGVPQPVQHIVEHRNRLIASTSFGLHLFRFHLPREANLFFVSLFVHPRADCK
jgi:hypothetical protein